jgi:hypothetical protein
LGTENQHGKKNKLSNLIAKGDVENSISSDMKNFNTSRFSDYSSVSPNCTNSDISSQKSLASVSPSISVNSSFHSSHSEDSMVNVGSNMVNACTPLSHTSYKYIVTSPMKVPFSLSPLPTQSYNYVQSQICLPPPLPYVQPSWSNGSENLPLQEPQQFLFSKNFLSPPSNCQTFNNNLNMFVQPEHLSSDNKSNLRVLNVTGTSYSSNKNVPLSSSPTSSQSLSFYPKSGFSLSPQSTINYIQPSIIANCPVFVKPDLLPFPPHKIETLNPIHSSTQTARQPNVIWKNNPVMIPPNLRYECMILSVFLFILIFSSCIVQFPCFFPSSHTPSWFFCFLFGRQ